MTNSLKTLLEDILNHLEKADWCVCGLLSGETCNYCTIIDRINAELGRETRKDNAISGDSTVAGSKSTTVKAGESPAPPQVCPDCGGPGYTFTWGELNAPKERCKPCKGTGNAPQSHPDGSGEQENSE